MPVIVPLMRKTPFKLDTQPLVEASSPHAGVLATSRAFRSLGFPDLIDTHLPLRTRLPRHQSGERTYPLHLHGHAAFHSPLLADNARRAMESLADTVDWRAPEVPLIDGRGRQWSPLATDTGALAEYTLRTQVTSTFDFTASVRVALREYAPDLLVCLGPGDALGAPVAQVIIQERWQGIDDRAAFLRRQRDDPLVVSFARDEQRLLVTAPRSAPGQGSAAD